MTSLECILRVCWRVAEVERAGAAAGAKREALLFAGR